MTHINYFLLATMVAAVPFMVAAAEPQELYISQNGQVQIHGGEVTAINALNYFVISVWGQKWSVTTDYATKFESAYGEPIQDSEIKQGHLLDVKGKPVPDKLGIVDAALVRDLSIKTGNVASTSPVFITEGMCVVNDSSRVKTLEEELAKLKSSSQRIVSSQVLPVSQTATSSPVSQTQTGSSFTKIAAKMLRDTLLLGMRNEQVLKLQEFLHKLGFISEASNVTGFFGKVTENALKEFQKANGLAAVGIAGAKTRDLINSLFIK